MTGGGSVQPVEKTVFGRKIDGTKMKPGQVMGLSADFSAINLFAIQPDSRSLGCQAA